MFLQRSAIKIDIVFSVIREINEILSLTNEPDKLVNTALDAITQTLNIECCWVQTISDRQNQKLCLAADRGFSDAMRAEIASMDLKHDFCGEIIGMGNKISIPDLNHDGLYGLNSFRAAGYRWLVAVPLLTYRVYGLLGAACRNKRNFDKNTTDLFMVVAGMIANALSKAELARNFPAAAKPRIPADRLVEARVARDVLLARINQKPVDASLPAINHPSTPPPENETVTAAAAPQKASRSSSSPPLVPLQENETGTVGTATLTISNPPDSPPPVNTLPDNKAEAGSTGTLTVSRPPDSPPPENILPEIPPEKKNQAAVPAPLKNLCAPDSPADPPPVTPGEIPSEAKKIAALLDKLKTLRQTYNPPPPRGALPENKIETPSVTSQKAPPALPALPPLPLPENKTPDDAPYSVKNSPAPDSVPPQPPPRDIQPDSQPQKPAGTGPVKKTQKQTAPAFSSHPRKTISYREAHRKR